MSIETAPTDALFTSIRAEHGDLIRATIRKLVAEPDQDDVESEIWISIWTALRRYEGRSALGTFVYPIVRRRIADNFRRRYREKKLQDKLRAQSEAEAAVAADPPPKMDDVIEATVLPTPAELRVLRALADGKSNDAIAQNLFLSKDTVRSHVKSLYKKTMLKNRGELVLLAHRFYKEEP